MVTTKQGYLVVADITGYTAYLSHSELEHAQDVLKTLLDLLIDHTRPPLSLSGLEGDAILSYSIESERFSGQAFVEMIEETYVAFRRAIDLMVLNTSCECNACANINLLDLKFFVHYGEFVLQKLGDREELVGSDVNLIHRLMKNEVVDRTGIRAYTLYTATALEHLDMEGFGDTLVSYSDDIQDLGHVEAGVQDMTPIWTDQAEKLTLTIAEKDRFVQEETEYPLPVEIIWDYLTRPETRAVFSDAKSQKVHSRREGRISEGSVYECFHGGN